MPAIKPVLCQQGYHFVTLDQLPRWIGSTLYEIEVRGEVLTAEDKSVAEQARLIKRVDTWNEKNLRLFAADCAEHVLGIYEKQYPNDERPRKSIQAARDFANGLIDAAAASVASNDAAYAASATAYAAAGATYAASAAGATYAASAAYVAYAAAAAYAASSGKAAVETQWQANRLKYYLEVE